jgi:hypothetical protein
MRFICLLLTLISGTLHVNRALAYPQFIGHGYPSCLNCHYNPLGNGPLTDYGRAVGADGIASGAFYPAGWSEEKIAALSGFLFRTPVQKTVRLQANYRGMEMVSAIGTASERWSWIHMQASGQLILKFLENDKLTVVGEVGYSPPSATSRAANQSARKIRSREHYVGYRISPEVGVYAGLMDKAYGIRVAEHIAFSRTLPELTQNDQTHGIMVHGLFDGWEGAIHGFVGNLLNQRDLRQRGGSATIERQLLQDHRFGASVMLSKNDYVKLLSYSMHSRFSLTDGSALLFEFGQTEKISLGNRGDRIGRYGLLQTFSRPFRGLYFIANIEYSKTDLSSPATSIRWGPGIQYFPIQKVELRGDLYNTRTFNPTATTQDGWMFLFQTHVWI